jgi:RNA 2',3'-cyclic 3'-phosphodiesterase
MEQAEKIRAFVALKPPSNWVEQIAALQTELQAKLGSEQFRWIGPEQIHVTVRFLGSISPQSIEGAVRILEVICAKLSPFTLVAGSLGCFPSVRRARVLWLGMQRVESEKDGVAEAASLYRLIAEGTAHIGEEPEDRPFQPHLTIARIKELSREKACALERIVSTSQSGKWNLSWRVDRVLLMRSHLSSKGARYETLHTTLFGGDLGG